MKEDAWVRFDREISVNLETGCWDWQGAKHARGYGQFRFRDSNWLAHRVAFVLYHQQEIPPGMVVMHRCDNPGCVGPNHLMLGTQADNMADKTAKGRQLTGSAVGNSKLTAEQVAAIRADTRTQRIVAAEHGVSQSQVSHIRTGKCWAGASL